MSDSGESASNPPEIPEDSLLLDRFQVIRPLGRGRFASVYQAKDLVRSGHVAIKVVAWNPGGDNVAGQHLLDELSVSERIKDHRHILQLRDAHVARWGGGELLLVVMELAEGGSLRSWLNKHRGNIETRQTLGVTVQTRFQQAERLYQQIERDLDTFPLAKLDDLVRETGEIYPEHPRSYGVQALQATRSKRYGSLIQQGCEAMFNTRWEAASISLARARELNPGDLDVEDLFRTVTQIVRTKVETRQRIEAACSEGDFDQADGLEICLERFLQMVQETLTLRYQESEI